MAPNGRVYYPHYSTAHCHHKGGPSKLEVLELVAVIVNCKMQQESCYKCPPHLLEEGLLSGIGQCYLEACTCTVQPWSNSKLHQMCHSPKVSKATQEGLRLESYTDGSWNSWTVETCVSRAHTSSYQYNQPIYKWFNYVQQYLVLDQHGAG